MQREKNAIKMTNRYWANTESKHGKKANCYCPPLKGDEMLNGHQKGEAGRMKVSPEMRTESLAAVQICTAGHTTLRDGETKVLTADGNLSKEYV